MKRILIVAGLVVLMFGLVVLGAIGSLVKAGANSPGQPVLTVGATNATLVLPVPACRPEGCQWGLFVFKVNPDKSQTPSGQGNAGVGQIVVPLPLNYCGQVQVDYGVFSNDGVFHKTDGHQYQVSTCTPTTTTTIGCPPNNTPPPCTTTTTPSTTTTTGHPDPTPSTAVPPPSSGGGSQSAPSVPQGASVPPLTPPVAVSPHLAYTGAPVGQMLAIGLGSVLSGLLLMRRRRAA